MAKRRGDLIYTFLGYVVILAILIVVASIIGGGVYLLLRAGVKPSQDSFVKWGGLIVFTPIVFGIVINYRATIGIAKYFGRPSQAYLFST